MSLFDTQLTTLQGEETTLGNWQGKVLLIVNVASKCGLTPQYTQLEMLQKQWQDAGFIVLGFPCNAFLGQEPGTNEEISKFCSMTYGVTFPMFSKIEVNGPERHPLYQQLITACPQATVPEGSEFLAKMISKGRAPQQPADILWNFEKFLVSRDGQVLQRFSPDMLPDDAHIVDAIKRAL
ncbi:MAG: Thioredoxin/glutathione peroxidase BtuE [Candidatus Erwinia impunctatus]|nr:Thioredoxin/glutathione peroxidase BtuE [Culicoides impunctatus]